MTPQSRRWTVFRLNQSSHNTLTYNRRPHDINGAARILSSSGAPGNETVLDMTAPLGLPEGATAIRSFAIDGDGAVTVTDTLTGLGRGDSIGWHMMTRAKVKPTTAGYVLSLGDGKLDLQLSSGQATGISAGDADPPPSGFDEKNPGFTRIQYRTEAGHDGEIVIRAVFQRRN
jgi:hypothetical protein